MANMTPDELRKRGKLLRQLNVPADWCDAAADAWGVRECLLDEVNERLAALEPKLDRIQRNSDLIIEQRDDYRQRLEGATPPPVVIRILTADVSELSEQIDNVTSLDEKEELVNWLDRIAILAKEER